MEFLLRNSSIFRYFLLPCMWLLSFSSQILSACLLCTQMKTGLKITGTTYSKEEGNVWYSSGQEISYVLCTGLPRWLATEGAGHLDNPLSINLLYVSLFHHFRTSLVSERCRRACRGYFSRDEAPFTCDHDLRVVASRNRETNTFRL